MTVSSLNTFRLKRALVRQNGGNCRVICCGDSTTQGQNGLTSFSSYLDSWVHKLGLLLNDDYGTVAADGIAIPPLGYLSDNRFFFGSGWNAGGALGAGELTAAYTGGSTEPLVFTPGVECDGFYLYYLQSPSDSGELTVTASGGTPVTLNNEGTAATLKSPLISCASASISNSLSIMSNGPGYVVAVEPVLSGISTIWLGNMGAGGSTTNGWVSNASDYGSIPLIKAIAPDVTIISLGINDAGQSISNATTSANLQTLINAAKLSGDVVLCSMPPSQNEAPWTTYEPGIVSAMSSLASSNDCLFADLYNRWGGSFNSPYMETDSPPVKLHPNNNGYWDWAQLMYEALTL